MTTTNARPGAAAFVEGFARDAGALDTPEALCFNRGAGTADR